LSPPANAVVLGRADHDRIMRSAAAVVTHGGHGTVMRALRHGLPVLCLVRPGMTTSDQPAVAAVVAEQRAGLAVAADAAAETIRGALTSLLAEDRFRGNARRLATELARLDGASLAADAFEGLLKPTPDGPSVTQRHAESHGNVR
jgi:UDP:flavonoid glycosyltransferase YjiC (YdhE family)